MFSKIVKYIGIVSHRTPLFLEIRTHKKNPKFSQTHYPTRYDIQFFFCANFKFPFTLWFPQSSHQREWVILRFPFPQDLRDWTALVFLVQSGNFLVVHNLVHFEFGVWNLTLAPYWRKICEFWCQYLKSMSFRCERGGGGGFLKHPGGFVIGVWKKYSAYLGILFSEEGWSKTFDRSNKTRKFALALLQALHISLEHGSYKLVDSQRSKSQRPPSRDFNKWFRYHF